jgi:hypothetical protein
VTIKIRYGRLLQLLMVAFRVTDEQGATDAKAAVAFEGRIKHLKRLNFPPPPAEGKSARIDYGAPEVVAMAMALVLEDCYAPPAAAARLVLQNWDTVLRFAGFALSGEVSAANPKVETLRTLLVFAPAALADLGQRAPRAGRYDAPVVAASIRTETLNADTVEALNGIVVDAVPFGRSIHNALAATGIEPRDVIAALLAHPA